MKRKTNLFYLSGPDSKFITFSNYTEALTGNFLSTDTKLFPDKFLCLKIGNLNSTTKSNFIKYLVRYYENKLAVLRDFCVNNDIKEEQNVLPLSYLIDGILNICEAGPNGFTLRQNMSPLEKDASYYHSTDNSNKLITYIGNITEQDYNGTYTDIICTINANEYKEGTIMFKSEVGDTKNREELSATISDYPDNLYGWENDTIFEEYGNIQPIYDGNNTYNFNTNKYGIYLTEPTTEGKTIEFNVIIPLFSITNMNYNTNVNMLHNESDNNGEYIPLTNYYATGDDELDTLYDNLMARINVPLGMWLYADETRDTFIQLKRDNQLNLYPAWSLLIASQFKPFPYSLKYRKENDIQNSIGNSYATFAETLTKVNDVLDAFNKININIQQINNRINSLEKNISEIGTAKNISQIEQNLLDLHTNVKNEIADFKKELYGYVDNITWSSKYDKNNN